MRRLRELSEAECYARCYGAGDDAVRILWGGSAARPVTRLSGEDARLLFAPRERPPVSVRRPVAAVAVAS